MSKRRCHKCKADISDGGHMIPRNSFGFFYTCCNSKCVIATMEETNTDRLLNGTSGKEPVGIMQDLKFTVQLELAFDYDMAPETDNER